MNKLYRTLPLGLRERPLDFYVAFVLFFVGIYGILDPTFPERYSDNLFNWFINIIGVYLVVSSFLILVSLVTCKNRLVFSYLSELYGWVMISAASLAISLMYLWFIGTNAPGSLTIWTSWISIWLGMSLASGLRAYDLYRRLKK